MYLNRIWHFILIIITAMTAGCAGPGPKQFPTAPVSIKTLPNSGYERFYDVDGNGEFDYCEQFSPKNILVSLGYDTSGDGVIDDKVELDKITNKDCRHLIIILDSIPFSMVHDLWRQGRFRYFSQPRRLISPFPVMTDLSLSEFFGTSPSPGIESVYFDGNYLTNGYEVYLKASNALWHKCIDYRLRHIAHPYAYMEPYVWYCHELRRIQDLFKTRAEKKITLAYVVGTSALGARIGRNGHQVALIQLDRFCQSLLYETRGRVRFTLLSDHGHKLGTSQYIPLPEILTTLGYRVSTKLDKPNDVIVPQFGIVTCASIYTHSPHQVARDMVGIEGVDLTAYLDDSDNVVVLSRNGLAFISKSASGFRYQPEYGDPLKLISIIDRLKKTSKVGDDGFINDRVFFDATVSHVYPDAIYRLWRAFHGLITHTPDVLISLCDGWHAGSPTMSNIISLTGAHGSLKKTSTSGFIMTTAGELPPVIRMEDAQTYLSDLGVPLNTVIKEGEIESR
ncbi:MAG: hypothetical protein JSV03_04875 [Planctomycetota bacterium]|nr:MAG: hypothetical protein JSV03_04875 [Planctomycetota bacterium]